jgi:hypothetical protein
MRTRFLLPLLLAVAASTWPAPARAQMGDAERAAARDLFKQGDQLQRAGNFTDALDRFQRAEQVIQAPTNVLRIAECQAALGKLVEAAEAYRSVVRWPLAAGAPPAFQSAIDQAKGELAQVEPRVPKLLVQVTPSGVANESLVIDGTAVPAALVGEPIPLDPGDHKVLVTAPGYSSPEQPVTLRERETKTLNVELHATATGAPPPVVGGTPPPPPPAYGSASPEPAAPPPFEPQSRANDRKDTRGSILLGVHLGLEIPTGTVPLTSTINWPNGANTAAMGDISGPGFAFALDGGVRFLHHWYLGLTLEHAGLAGGKNSSALNANGGSLSSDTTALGIVGAFIAIPDKPSFYGELGLQSRWYNFTVSGLPTQSYSSGELMIGVGLWLPIGRYFRLIPLGTAGFGTFEAPNSSSSSGGPGHAFVMIGLEGIYNIDL